MTAAAIVAGSASSSADVSGGGLSHACALPSSVAAGNLLIVVVGVWGPSGIGTDITPATPSGWTSLINNQQDDFAFVLGWRTFYKIASGSEGSSVSVSWVGAGATTVVASAARVTGHDATTPIDTYGAANFYSNPPSVSVNGAKLDSLLIRGILYAYPQVNPTTPSGHTIVTGLSGGAYNARNYMIQRTWTAAGATGSTLYAPGADGAGASSYTIAVAPSASTAAIAMNGLSQTATLGQHDALSTAPTIVMADLSQDAVLGTHGVTAANTDQGIVMAGLDQTAVLGLVNVVAAAPQTVVMVGLSQTAALGSHDIVPVIPFLGTSPTPPWGASRRWNAWVEFHVGSILVASSANGDFALVGGKITEDISRPIRRDVQVSLMFPTGQTLSTGAVYALSTGESFDVGEDLVGSDSLIGGTGTGVATVLIPAQRALTTRSVFIPTNVGDLLDPNGPTVMKVWAGFYGSEVPMGTFDLSSVPVRVTEGGATLEVTGQSFERRIGKAGFWEVVALPAGTTAALGAAALILDALPGVTLRSVINDTSVAELSYKPGDSRLTKVIDLLAAGGLEGGFNRANDYVMTEAPSMSDIGTAIPNWEVLDGVNASVATLNSATRDFSDENSYNGVVIEGDSHDTANTPPIIYTLWNTNPGSPLFYDPNNPAASLTGPRPKYVRSELVRTTEGAVAVAQAELAKVLMISDSVDAAVPANAAIEMGHFARVASEALGLDGVYRINRVVHDLTGGPAQLSMYRYQQV